LGRSATTGERIRLRRVFGITDLWLGSVCERSHDRRDNRCYNVSVNTTDLPAQDTHTLHDPTKHFFIESEFERRTKHRTCMQLLSRLCRTETQFAEQLRASISNIEHGVAKD
jgi:hypothetical protein